MTENNIFAEFSEDDMDCSFVSENNISVSKNSSEFKSAVSGTLSNCFKDRKETTVPKKLKKKYSLNIAEKHTLAADVEQRPLIWDISNPLHCKSDAIIAAWKEISDLIAKPVSECKSAWISLREGKRYRATTTRKRKSGDDGGEYINTPVLVDDNAKDWEFAKSLSFLPDVTKKKKRRTITVGSSERSLEAQDDTSNRAASSSNYLYVSSSSSNNKSKESTSAEKIASSIAKYVYNCSKQETTLKFETVYGYWDRMLAKLSDEDLDDLTQEISTIIYNKVKETSL